MEDKLLNDLRKYLSELKVVLANSEARFNELRDYAGLRLKQGHVSPKGTVYYNVLDPATGELRYAGNESKPQVFRIQESRYLSVLMQVVKHDIGLLEDFLAKYESIKFEHINSKLPKGYRNAKALGARSRKRIARRWKKEMEEYKARFPEFRPEEKTVTTVDKTKVRSRGEGLIYNYLHDHGYTFVYELPLKGETRMFYPDFTILSEIDYKTIIRIEHQGKMGNEEYKEKAEDREYDYWCCGFLPNRDVYFTYDDVHGGFDITPVIDILEMKVRPSARS